MRLFSGCCRSCWELLQTLPVPMIISAPFVFLAVLSFPSAVFFLSLGRTRVASTLPGRPPSQAAPGDRAVAPGPAPASTSHFPGWGSTFCKQMLPFRVQVTGEDQSHQCPPPALQAKLAAIPHRRPSLYCSSSAEFSLLLFKEHLPTVWPALPCIAGGSNQLALPGLKTVS